MSISDPAPLFAAALSLHRAGRRSDAEGLCRTILAGHPKHVDAHHLLAVLALDDGREEEARREVETALGIAPQAANLHYTLGNVLVAQGRLAQAGRAYLAALSRSPDYPEAHHNLAGLVQDLLQRGEAAAGRALAAEWVAAHPGNAQAVHMAGALGVAGSP